MESIVSSGADRILVVGHRGAEALAPENTWPSLLMGYEAGADLLELDVQLSRDGQAIVYHDFTLGPKFGDPRWVRDLTWDELSGLDAGSWFAPAFAGERIPRLADVLEWARGRVPLWVDLKHGFAGPQDDALEVVALDLIESAGMDDQVVISSWDQVALARIQTHCPDLPLAVNLRQRVRDPVAQVSQAGVQWVVVYWPQIDRRDVTRLKQAGLLVCLTGLFTAEYAQAVRLGVDAVTAEDPIAARMALSRTQMEHKTIDE